MRLLWCLFPLVILLTLCQSAPAAGANTQPDAIADRQAQIEADWFLQDTVRVQSGPQGGVSTQEDAAGGCDGIKDGKWGFHTNSEARPWWQVDLGNPCELARVVIYNRCDGASERAARLIILLSTDGRAWKEAYRHNGIVFHGAPDGKPLAAPLNGAVARFVRVQLPDTTYLHFDEVEVYGAADPASNLALGRPANQSSVSQWSTKKARVSPNAEVVYPVEKLIERGRKLAADLKGSGGRIDALGGEFEEAAAAAKALPASAAAGTRRAAYIELRWAVRKLAFANPLLDFDGIVFAKQVPPSFNHMSDQYYGWWSRPGGGVFILRGLKSDSPRLTCLTSQFAEGSFLRPDLLYDAERILFAYCKYYPHMAGVANKVDKERLPEDAFYHIFEMSIDGTGLRQLTRGRYDDFDARYLPSGEIVFLSTRRGQFIQCGKASAAATTRATLPDSYVRCGGDASRPVAVYTLHVMDADGGNLRAISPFENFEWTPSVANDGRVFYARWDYVDRDNMPFMSLWSTNPDGTNPQAVYGNFTRNPHCIFEARSVPNSSKILFTASAHHAITAGSLCMLDVTKGFDGPEPLTRLTPEVCFPESEGWPATFYTNPFPLSERYYLTAWSSVPIQTHLSTANGLGLYLYDAFGNLELIYRDPAISSMYPLPLRARSRPPVLASSVAWDGPQQGRMILANVYDGLPGIPRGTVKRLRIVGVPAKTQPNMDTPKLGITHDDPGKFVLGTIPVEEDGSAHFRVPSGMAFFLQALDADGLAVQTMRTVTYVQPNQTVSCVGCHEPRNSTPPNLRPLAASRAASKIRPGPDGSWPMHFSKLVQPVLDKSCVSCHRPGSADKVAAGFDLTAEKAYNNLVTYGKPSLAEHVITRYREGRSPVGGSAARQSPLLALLRAPDGHHGVCLDPDSLARFATWMDTYAQVRGSFSDDQDQCLCELRRACADLLEQ
jgi:hypothetical protein